MNPELQKFLEAKMDEIKATVSQYLQPVYGDVEIRRIEIEDNVDENDDGTKTRKIEITVWTDKGYINIES